MYRFTLNCSISALLHFLVVLLIQPCLADGLSKSETVTVCVVVSAGGSILVGGIIYFCRKKKLYKKCCRKSEQSKGAPPSNGACSSDAEASETYYELHENMMSGKRKSTPNSYSDGPTGVQAPVHTGVQAPVLPPLREQRESGQESRGQSQAEAAKTDMSSDDLEMEENPLYQSQVEAEKEREESKKEGGGTNTDEIEFEDNELYYRNKDTEETQQDESKINEQDNNGSQNDTGKTSEENAHSGVETDKDDLEMIDNELYNMTKDTDSMNIEATEQNDSPAPATTCDGRAEDGKLTKTRTSAVPDTKGSDYLEVTTVQNPNGSSSCNLTNGNGTHGQTSQDGKQVKVKTVEVTDAKDSDYLEVTVQKTEGDPSCTLTDGKGSATCKLEAVTDARGSDYLEVTKVQTSDESPSCKITDEKDSSRSSVDA